MEKKKHIMKHIIHILYLIRMYNFLLKVLTLLHPVKNSYLIKSWRQSEIHSLKVI